MAKRRKPKAKHKPKLFRIREDKLRPLIREAARTGLVEAIEHCENFWEVSDGYKKYIDERIAAEAEAFLTAVRVAVRTELALRELANRRRKPRKR